MSEVPIDTALRGAAAMAAAAIGCGVDVVTALERANNGAQILMTDRDGRVSWMAEVLRELVRDVATSSGRHDLVASMGAAWSITLGGYPLSTEAEQLYRRARAQRGLEAVA